MMTTASEHKIDKVEKMAGGKGHVIIEHLLGEAELDGKCGLYAKVTIEPGCTLFCSILIISYYSGCFSNCKRGRKDFTNRRPGS